MPDNLIGLQFRYKGADGIAYRPAITFKDGDLCVVVRPVLSGRFYRVELVGDPRKWGWVGPSRIQYSLIYWAGQEENPDECEESNDPK